MSDEGDSEDEDYYIPVEVAFTARRDKAIDPAEMTEPTVLERLIRAGISRDRACAFLGAGAVRVDGTQVTDPETPAAPPARIVLLPA